MRFFKQIYSKSWRCQNAEHSQKPLYKITELKRPKTKEQKLKKNTSVLYLVTFPAFTKSYFEKW